MILMLLKVAASLFVLLFSNSNNYHFRNRLLLTVTENKLCVSPLEYDILQSVYLSWILSKAFETTEFELLLCSNLVQM